MLNKFIAALRDPLWQFLGVLVTLVGLFYGGAVKSNESGELSIVPFQSFNPFFVSTTIQSKMKIELGDKILNPTKINQLNVLIENKAGKPLKPGDFIEDLTVNSPKEKILWVEDSDKKTVWRKIDDNTWALSRTLLNSPSSVWVSIILEKEHGDSSVNMKTPGEGLAWSAKIVDFEIKSYKNYTEYVKESDKLSWLTAASVALYGVAVYIFFFGQIGFFALGLISTRLAKRNIGAGKWGFVYIACLATFSTTASEFATDVLYNAREQAPVAIIFLLFLLFIMVVSLKKSPRI